MNNYKPPFEITDNIMNYVAQICEKLGYLQVTTNFDSKLHLRRNNRIKSIHSSLKIEANSLSINQVRDVINGKTVIGEREDIQEVKNAFEAYRLIPEIDPYSLDDLLKLHGIMTRYLINQSGMFRLGDEGVFDGDRCIFMAPSPAFVANLMNQLFTWMYNEKNKVHPLIMSCVFHYEFVFIHPFSDGNGRMARLWHTALLSKWKPIFEYIPLETQIEKFQNDYYKVIADCHIEGSSTSFIEFMLCQINNVLDELISLGNTDYLNEHVKKLLSVMEYDVPYTKKTLMSMLNLKSVTSFRDNYLVPALKMNLVRMEHPDKPSSRIQRYIRNEY